jgi:thioredoxin reductase (NADPH)
MTDSEIAIVGGGPAGLAAAIYLARLRRSVCLIDAGRSRLASIPRTHNYPGFPEGIAGAALLSALRQQAANYPIRSIGASVEALEPVDGGFRLKWEGGSLSASLVLLATGASDVPPTMPYLADALRAGLLRYCPVCDGYEVMDRAIGVVADAAAGLEEALYLRHFTPRITLFMLEGAAALAETDRHRLQDAGIRLAEDAICGIRPLDGKIAVRHGDGETVCDSIYSALGLRVHSGLAGDLGAEVDESGYLLTDRHHATTVPGLYAAGDVALGLNQITVAAGGAAIAGAAMHLALGRSAPR